MYLSVIIPTRNRSSLLAKVIQSVIHQTYPRDNFEIIIVDNGSNDETKRVVESYKDVLPNLIYIYESKPGLHAGRHTGLAKAKGDILVYGDDDIEAFPTWLEGVAESFEDLAVALVGGNNLPQYESPPPLWIETLWQKTQWGKTMGIFSLLDFGDDIQEISPHYVYGCNFSIRKKILIEFGGFHPDSMPDHLLKFRGDGETAVSEAILRKGYKTIFNPKASVYHGVSTSRMTNGYLYKRGYLQGISNSYSEIRKKGTYSRIQFVFYPLRYGIIRCKNSLRNLMILHNSPIDSYNQGSQEGFLFHRKMVFVDPVLLEWILKIDYLSDP